MERDDDLKTREEGAELAAQREAFGRVPYAWDKLPPPPPSVAASQTPQKIVEGQAPKVEGAVTAVWDSRPVNALDFVANWNYWATEVPGPSVNTVQSASYRVPGTYVAFVRSITYYWLVAGGGMFDAVLASPSQITVDLFVDGVAQGVWRNLEPSPPPSNQWMQAIVGAVTPNEGAKLPSIGIDVPCFVIAPPGSLIELRAFTAFGLSSNIAEGLCTFAGTLRLARGLSPNFEVIT